MENNTKKKSSEGPSELEPIFYSDLYAPYVPALTENELHWSKPNKQTGKILPGITLLAFHSDEKFRLNIKTEVQGYRKEKLCNKLN